MRLDLALDDDKAGIAVRLEIAEKKIEIYEAALTKIATMCSSEGSDFTVGYLKGIAQDVLRTKL